MCIKRFCILLTISTSLALSLAVYVAAAEPPHAIASSSGPRSVSSPTPAKDSAVATDPVPTPDPYATPDLTVAPDPPADDEDSVTSSLAGAAEDDDPTTPDLATASSDPPTTPAPGEAPRMMGAPGIDFGLDGIVASLEKALPETWSVADIKRGQIPRKWAGSSDAVLIKIEDGSVVVQHPNGFYYHPFYKLWLCPSAWQGSMDDVDVLGSEGPSFLLGINRTMKVFYLALGVNTWPEGPGVLRKALDLTVLPITGSLQQVLDSSMKMMLVPRLAATKDLPPGFLSRVVGMEKDGPLVYLEYATATKRQADGLMLPSRCKDPRITSLRERENLFLADQIFFAYPEVQTVYVRRVCDDLLSDRIFDRPGPALTAAPAPTSIAPASPTPISPTPTGASNPTR